MYIPLLCKLDLWKKRKLYPYVNKNYKKKS